MKKFFFNLLSSFVGAWIAIVLFCVVAVMVCISLVSKFSSGSDSFSMSDKSVLVLELNGEIAESEPGGKPSLMDIAQGNISSPVTLTQLVSALEEGAADKSVKALYIECGGSSASPATLNALRNAVLKFKESKKPVYAYGDFLAQGDYFVASVADSIFLNPQGQLELHGIAGQVPYMKGFFDKIGVSFEVVKVGTFKSAVEPYIMEHMSEPARAQLDTLYGEMWGYITDKIAEARKVKPAQINSLINYTHITFSPAETALKNKLVDGLCYGREIDSHLAAAVGVDREDLNKVPLAKMTALSSLPLQAQTGTKNQIAVLYANGGIDDGEGGINTSEMVSVINDLTENDNVKGLVMRVNSPGGSAFGSEQMWEALEAFKASGKPFAVSMGDFAASGGYYISSGAQRIFADPLTVTGSIGIFGLFPQVEGLVTGKLGVNMETVATNPGASFPTLFTPLTADQREVLQQYIDRGYALFVSRCAKGRNKSDAYIRTIAEGRVWSGIAAKRIGLVDELGSLDDAIAWVEKKADLKNATRVAYPEIDNSLRRIVGQFEQTDALRTLLTRYGLEMPAEGLNALSTLATRHPIQARMAEMTIKL